MRIFRALLKEASRHRRIVVGLAAAFLILGAGISQQRGPSEPRAASAAIIAANDTSAFLAADDLPLIDSPRLGTTSEDDPLGIRREFYAKFLEERGEEIREATFSDLVAQFNPKEFAPRYTLLDLNVSSDNSQEAIRAYANAFAAILNKHSGFQFRKVELTLKEAFETKSLAALNGLQKPAIAYRNLAADLKGLSVPSSAADEHLAIVNAQDVISRAIAGMLYSFEDPIRGAGGYHAYIAHLINIKLSHMRMIVYFSRQGVKFSPDDLAYRYFKIPTRKKPAEGTAASATAAP